jgi:putative phosphoribosyl transferase
MARRYSDRRDAGRALAARLARYRGDPAAIVLALPRGGVPVGFEVAHALGLPLDVLVVRKLGLPAQPELAMGAVASGGAVVLNDEVLRLLPAGSDTLERVKGRELLELARREQAYRGDREPLAVRGRTCIVVDDGLATGATMAAALRAMQNSQAGRIVAAVPVASSEALERIAAIADEVVCPHAPPWFSAVGQWYERFDQTEDDEVRELMSQAAGPPAARESRDNLPPRA